jgi:hypothetical protein
MAKKSKRTTMKKKVTKAKSSISKMGAADPSKLVKTTMESVIKKKGQNYECQICGRSNKTPIDAMTHLLDHGSTALAGMSKLVQDQREGNVTKEGRRKADKEGRRKEDMMEAAGKEK